MGLVTPWFLAGLAAVALPLYLHLLRRSQNTPRPVSSLMFFERRIESVSRQRRLQYLALLAARLALLAFIVLAFAGPFVLRTAPSSNHSVLTVLVIDRSFSMRGRNSLAQAKAEASRFAAALPGSRQVTVLAFDQHVETVSQPARDVAAARNAISQIAASDLESSLGELVRSLRVLARDRRQNLEVHLFSDLQQTSMPADFHDLALGEGIALTLHRAGSAAPNWAVESVRTSAHVFDPKTTRLEATIAGWQTAGADISVELSLDRRVLATQTVHVMPNGRGTVEFRGFNVPYGQHRGEVRIAVSDALVEDNVLRFSLERRDPRPVLFVYGNGRKQDAFYYRVAMQSVPDSGLTIEAAPLSDLHSKDLQAFAFVVLHNVGNLESDLDDKICRYVMGGGAALVALGAETAEAGRIPLSKTEVHPGRETLEAGVADRQQLALHDIGSLSNVQFRQAPHWTPTPHDEVVARFSNGDPLLVLRRPGEGRILVISSALDGRGSDFPLHTSFVPFVAQTGRFLAGGEGTAPTYVTGVSVPLRQAGSNGSSDKAISAGGNSADVIGPAGDHPLTLAQLKSSVSFTLEREGFYQVVPASGLRQLLAAHASRLESNLQPISQETLELWRNTGGGEVPALPAVGVSEGQRRQEFWRWLLAASVVAAIVESVVARRHRQGEPDVA